MKNGIVGFSKLRELPVRTGWNSQRTSGAGGDDGGVSRTTRDDGLEGSFQVDS